MIKLLLVPTTVVTERVNANDVKAMEHERHPHPGATEFGAIVSNVLIRNVNTKHPVVVVVNRSSVECDK